MKKIIGKATMLAAVLSLGACGTSEKESEIANVHDLDAGFVSSAQPEIIEGMPEAAIVRIEFDTKTKKILKIGNTAAISASTELSDSNLETVYNSASAESIGNFSSADSFPSSNYCPQSAYTTTTVQSSYYANNNCGLVGQLPPIVNPTTVQNQDIYNNNVINQTTHNNTDIYKRTINTVNVHDLGSTTHYNYTGPQNAWQIPQAQLGQYNYGCQSGFCQGNQGGFDFGVQHGFSGLNNWNNPNASWVNSTCNSLRPVTYFNAQNFVNRPRVAGYPVLNPLRKIANRVRRFRAGMPYSRLYVPQHQGNIGIGYATYCRTRSCSFLR